MKTEFKGYCAYSLEGAIQVLSYIDFPVRINPSFGYRCFIVDSFDDFEKNVLIGLNDSPINEVNIDKVQLKA